MIQFTVRRLLAATAFVAIVCGGLFAFSPRVAAGFACVLIVAVPAALIVCLVYGRPSLRAFAIGALAPYAMRLCVGGSTAAGVRSLVFSEIRERAALASAQLGGYSQVDSAYEYIDTAMNVLDDFGHALMADEAMILVGSLVAGLASLATWNCIRRSAE